MATYPPWNQEYNQSYAVRSNPDWNQNRIEVKSKVLANDICHNCVISSRVHVHVYTSMFWQFYSTKYWRINLDFLITYYSLMNAFHILFPVQTSYNECMEVFWYWISLARLCNIVYLVLLMFASHASLHRLFLNNLFYIPYIVLPYILPSYS